MIGPGRKSENYGCLFLVTNASNKSHAELDECEKLDDGDPEALGEAYHVFSKNLKQLNVIGGCCGTDHRHVEAICHET